HGVPVPRHRPRGGDDGPDRPARTPDARHADPRGALRPWGRFPTCLFRHGRLETCPTLSPPRPPPEARAPPGPSAAPPAGAAAPAGPTGPAPPAPGGWPGTG